MQEKRLTRYPDVRFVRRDACSLKEVADYIAGTGAPPACYIHDGKKVGLAEQKDCPDVELTIKRMTPGDKVLVIRRRQGSTDLPSGVLIDEEELRESRLRFLFYVRQ